MLQIRPSSTLDGADFGWLKAKHHFAVGPEGNPANAPLGALVIWNDDEIAPGTGFGLHSHADMEIISYVRDGVVTHRDSIGNTGRTEAGDVQVMSAGAGVRHAEYNLEPGRTRLFQIWIEPKTHGGEPSWGAKPFPKSDRSGRFVTLASGRPGDEGALAIRADARVLGATVKAGETITYDLDPARHAYLVPSTGSIEVNGVHIGPRDGAAATDEKELRITALEDAELVLVDSL